MVVKHCFVNLFNFKIMGDVVAIALFLGGIFSIIVVIIALKSLSSINKEQKRTNYLLYKKMLNDGVKFTDEDYLHLNQ